MMSRDYFYVGGQYVADGTGQHTFRAQMYVEHLAPLCAPSHPYPLVFIHWQAQTGTVDLIFLILRWVSTGPFCY